MHDYSRQDHRLPAEMARWQAHVEPQSRVREAKSSAIKLGRNKAELQFRRATVSSNTSSRDGIQRARIRLSDIVRLRERTRQPHVSGKHVSEE